jgi:hypothetical protein
MLSLMIAPIKLLIRILATDIRYQATSRNLHERCEMTTRETIKKLRNRRAGDGVAGAFFWWKRDLEYLRSRIKTPITYDREANGYHFGSKRGEAEL